MFYNVTAELQLAEAVALINTIQDWTVVDKIILSTKNADQLFIFGKGNFQLLTGKKKFQVLKRVFFLLLVCHCLSYNLVNSYRYNK